MTVPQAPHGPEPVPLRCPRCGAHVGPEQDWCLECGAPARTRLAPAPNWRLPIALVAAVVLAAGVALALAFTALTDDDGVVTTPTVTTAPAQPNETSTATVPTAPPVTDTAPAAAPSVAAPAEPATTTPTTTSSATPAPTGTTPPTATG